MDLDYDWKNFQSIFYPKKRMIHSEVQGFVSVIVENGLILTAYSDEEDLSNWSGRPISEIQKELFHRHLMFFERDKVDELLTSSVSASHFYDQISFLRSEAKPFLDMKGGSQVEETHFNTHFLLMVIASRWAKVFPSNYGIFLRLDGVAGPSLLMIVQRGRLASFHVPDLSPMIPERRKHSSDVVKFLSERHLVPIQGLFLTSAEWFEWSEMANPWPKIALALKGNRNKLVPFKWGVAGLIASRAYFKL